MLPPPGLGLFDRRELIRIGSLALGGLGLDQVLAGRAAAGQQSRQTAVILLYLHGGPSQLETYDLKPQAPSEYRSVFQPIGTNVPGLDICQHFPLQAKIADKYSLVRSLHHDVGIHSDGGIITLTGKRPTVLDVTSQSKSEHPDVGMVASRMRGLGETCLPPYIAIPAAPYMTRPAYLGRQHEAYVASDPGADSYAPPRLKLAGGRTKQQFDDRRGLLQQFDRFRGDIDARGVMSAGDRFRELAFTMLTSPQMAEAFDIAQEDTALRDRYGRHSWGQSCLLARRLAEAGSAVISLYINTPRRGSEFTNWDDHIQNAGQPGHFGGFMERRLPFLDQALSALIEDIHARGRQQEIMVVVMGEFGRTPRLSHNSFGTGRDHWPQAYTALVSGGGLRMGQVVGATNSKAEYPTDRPYSPQDLLATIYRHLGIDWNASLIDYSGRPVPILPDARPIAELI
ncbi:MAG: DUF1501 domain-containing protein [Pirellulales bacterium]